MRDGPLEFIVDNHAPGGDPEYGVAKTLRITWRLGEWGTASSFGEGETVRLPIDTLE